MQRHGLTRAQLRQGGGRDVGEEHFGEVLGSQEFWIYVTPNKKPKGYDSLKTFLESQGCQVRVVDDAPLSPGKGYKAIKITYEGAIISDAVLLRAHRWAHQRNFLHSFFRPFNTGAPGTGATGS